MPLIALHIRHTYPHYHEHTSVHSSRAKLLCVVLPSIAHLIHFIVSFSLRSDTTRQRTHLLSVSSMNGLSGQQFLLNLSVCKTLSANDCSAHTSHIPGTNIPSSTQLELHCSVRFRAHRSIVHKKQRQKEDTMAASTSKFAFRSDFGLGRSRFPHFLFNQSQRQQFALFLNFCIA